MTENTPLIEALYSAFARGDIPAVLAALAPTIEWTEAAGGPYGGVSIGPQAVLENVFMKLGGEWDGFAAVPARFISEDDMVIVLGEYSATYSATGKSFRAPFAHAWTLADGQVTVFEQYTDTAVHLQPMR